MPYILYGLRDPITSVESEMVSLSQVAITLHINHRQQAALYMTFAEARDFLSCLAEDTPIIGTVNGKRCWLNSYTKPQLIDGLGNIVERKDAA